MSRLRLLGDKDSSGYTGYGSLGSSTSSNGSIPAVKQLEKNSQQSIHVLMSSVFNSMTYMFPSIKYNAQHGQEFIGGSNVSKLAHQFSAKGEKLSGLKAELKALVIEEISSKGMTLDSMTDMGLKLRQGELYQSLTDSLAQLLTSKLESDNKTDYSY